MANNKQKAQIHILKDDLGLSREHYEAMLSRWDVASSADPAFTTDMADELIGQMRQMMAPAKSRYYGWGKEKYECLRPRPAHMGDPAQLRKIEAMWRERARNTGDGALANFLKRQGGKKNIIWLTKPDVEAVICALEKI